MERNLPTPEGRKIGASLARLTPQVPEMCSGCAFKHGAFANGCYQTVRDAVQCVIVGTPFHCHMKREPNGEESICAGFISALRDRNRIRFERRRKK